MCAVDVSETVKGQYYLACECDEIYCSPDVKSSFVFELNPYKQSSKVDYDDFIETQVFTIGKYKRATDESTDYHREALAALRESTYLNWLEKVSSARGKKREEVELFVNKGHFEVEKLKDAGFISALLSAKSSNKGEDDNEVINLLKERFTVKSPPPIVLYEKYAQVKKSTLGISRGKELIAIIRASGRISHVLNPPVFPSNFIFAEKIIQQIRMVNDSDKFKAVIIRIDSPGGDSLASELIWREIKLIKIPVVVSTVDATSGAYYMAVGGKTILSENLYEKFNITKHIISSMVVNSG